MSLKFIHVCTKCGEAFDDEVNTPKNEAVCPHCTMLPEVKEIYYKDAPAGLTPGGIRAIITPIKDSEEKNVEFIDSGMTGGHVVGTANLAASHPQRHHIFKKKPCKKCKKLFQPNAGNAAFCPACRPLTIKNSARAKKYAAELITPRHGPGRPLTPLKKVELEKLADGLLTERRDMSGLSKISPTYYLPNLTLLKKKDLKEPMPGYWVQIDDRQNFERRQIVTSKNLLSGQIVVDIWNPRERFISDSTTSGIHGSPLAQGNDCCGCTPPPDVPSV
jgi:hypothetical protein